MNMETLDYGHWVIDNDLEQFGFDRMQKLALDSIDSQISDNLDFFDKDLPIQDKMSSSFCFDSLNSEIKIPFDFRTRKALSYFKKTQQWVGVVIEIRSDEFTAKLFDKEDNTTYEIADFDFIEVSRSDYSLIEIGAVFYYSLGFASNNGQITKESFLRFKRSTPFTEFDVDSIEERVKKLEQNINWE